MQTRSCPDCGDDISVYAKVHSCGWRAAAKPKDDVPRPKQHRLSPEAQEAYEAGAPRSHDLTEQQWYNVCRFWPTVAKRCSRPFADVGTHNPLHATSRQGPLMRKAVIEEAALERAAIQAECST